MTHEKAIYILKNTEWYGTVSDLAEVEKAIRILEDELPCRGWWIREPNCWYKCSVCSAHYPSIAANMNYNYCPSCGARMENKDE